MQFAKYCEKQLIVVPSISQMNALLDMKFENGRVFSDRTGIEFELKYSTFIKNMFINAIGGS